VATVALSTLVGGFAAIAALGRNEKYPALYALGFILNALPYILAFWHARPR
jgi:hypothetical protein